MKATNTVRAQLREAFESIQRVFWLFGHRRNTIRATFCLYCGLTMKAFRSSRLPEDLQHTAIV